LSNATATNTLFDVKAGSHGPRTWTTKFYARVCDPREAALSDASASKVRKQRMQQTQRTQETQLTQATQQPESRDVRCLVCKPGITGTRLET